MLGVVRVGEHLLSDAGDVTEGEEGKGGRWMRERTRDVNDRVTRVPKSRPRLLNGWRTDAQLHCSEPTEASFT